MPFAELHDARIWYMLEGEPGSPVVVLSNSLGADLTMWDAQVPALLTRFRVLRYDTRGHGLSSTPQGPYTIADLGTDVLELLNLLELETVSFCGLSMGGMTGMWLGIHEGKRLSRLILSSTAAKIGTEQTWQERVATVQQKGLEGIVDGVLSRWFTRPFLDDRPRYQAVREMFLRTSAVGYVACCQAISTMDQRRLISAIANPTLILSGAADPVTTPADGRFLEQSIPGAAYIELSGAHLTNLEFPEAYNRVLLGFLTS